MTVQIITANWQDTIQSHIVSMEKAYNAAREFPPGPDHKKHWQLYEGVCHDFVDHIHRHFVSDRGFDDFLKAEARVLTGHDSRTDREISQWEKWFEESGIVPQAEALRRRFTTNFLGALDAAFESRVMPEPRMVIRPFFII